MIENRIHRDVPRLPFPAGSLPTLGLRLGRPNALLAELGRTVQNLTKPDTKNTRSFRVSDTESIT